MCTVYKKISIRNFLEIIQIDWLHLSFFNLFPQYEDKITNYPSFYEEYMKHEKVQKL